MRRGGVRIWDGGEFLNRQLRMIHIVWRANFVCSCGIVENEYNLFVFSKFTRHGFGAVGPQAGPGDPPRVLRGWGPSSSSTIVGATSYSWLSGMRT